MDMFDTELKRRAALEPNLAPVSFEANSDALLASLGAAESSRKPFMLRPFLRIAAAAVLAAILLVGCAYTAYTLSGGEYFKAVFQAKVSQAPGEDYSYMNTDQLTDMQSSTVGRVVDTPELSVDVLGAIAAGNTAEIALKITAAQLDTVLISRGEYDKNRNDKAFYESIGRYMNYAFRNDVGPQVAGSVESVQTRYIYSDMDDSLAPNAFVIQYLIIGKTSLKDDIYTIRLSDFGYTPFDENNRPLFNQFTAKYDKTWSFDITFNQKGDTTRTVMINKEVNLDYAPFKAYTYVVDSVTVTPLFCILQAHSSVGYSEGSYYAGIGYAFASSDFSVKLKDGTILHQSIPKTFSEWWGPDGAGKAVVFDVPITVDDVVSITVGGTEIPLQ